MSAKPIAAKKMRRWMFMVFRVSRVGVIRGAVLPKTNLAANQCHALLCGISRGIR
jgi:hypothetical protein